LLFSSYIVNGIVNMVSMANGIQAIMSYFNLEMDGAASNYAELYMTDAGAGKIWTIASLGFPASNVGASICGNPNLLVPPGYLIKLSGNGPGVTVRANLKLIAQPYIY
jgi:hypothetical protein